MHPLNRPGVLVRSRYAKRGVGEGLHYSIIIFQTVLLHFKIYLPNTDDIIRIPRLYWRHHVGRLIAHWNINVNFLKKNLYSLGRLMWCKTYCNTIGGWGGGEGTGARDAPPSSGSSFHFHAVLGKNWPNNRLTLLQGWRPPPPVGNPGSVTECSFNQQLTSVVDPENSRIRRANSRGWKRYFNLISCEFPKLTVTYIRSRGVILMILILWQVELFYFFPD